MEGHQNLLAIAGVQNAQTEWQHTAHEIIAVAVHRLALGIVKAQQQLDADAEKHQAYRPSPVAAIEQQSIYDVKLQHQTEKPVRAWPDDVVGVGQYIVKHTQHRYDAQHLVMAWTRSDVVYHRESDETHDHHLEELQIVIADEAQRFAPADTPGLLPARNAVHLSLLVGRKMRLGFILHHQSVRTQEEEYGHSVMTEERQQMDRQVDVGIRHHLQQPVGVVLEELIFILLDNRT